MHIPAGFLQPQVWVPMAAVSAAGVGYAIKKTGTVMDERKTPVMGVMAAFIFAAQMVNFPVLGGTSGHLLGAALATAVLGMWPGMIVIASVVIVQALLFQDGGIDALGANIFNMSILGCLISGIIIGAGKKFGDKSLYLSVIFAGWLSVIAASFSCSVQLVLSGTIPFNIVVPAMLFIHAVIGVFEGLISVVALKFIISFNPGLVTAYNGVKS